jgi:thiol-disulfide isomerase/thioredoxin
MGSKKLYEWFTKSNSITAILVVFILMMIIFPEVKAKVIIGFMKVGLFKPDILSVTIQNPEKSLPLAPDAEFNNENGSSVSLLSLKGKVVFINFWATWCAPCMAEMPGINGLYNKTGKDNRIVFIIADADGNFDKSKKFMTTRNYNLPLFKAGGSVPESLFSGTLPTTIVVNKKGEIVFHEQGVANYETQKFEDFLKKLAAE